MIEFKEVVSKRLIGFLRDVEAFKDIFTNFVADVQPKYKDLPVFQRDVAHYLSFFKFDVEALMKELDADIAKPKIVKENNNLLKETKLKQAVSLFSFQALDGV